MKNFQARRIKMIQRMLRSNERSIIVKFLVDALPGFSGEEIENSPMFRYSRVKFQRFLVYMNIIMTLYFVFYRL
jgi:hypothetical protein